MRRANPTSCGAADMPAIVPDRAALEIAHSRLGSKRPLDEMLQVASLRKLLELQARWHMKRRVQFDPKKLQAGDTD
jgi:hypothetical protein